MILLSYQLLLQPSSHSAFVTDEQFLIEEKSKLDNEFGEREQTRKTDEHRKFATEQFVFEEKHKHPDNIERLLCDQHHGYRARGKKRENLVKEKGSHLV